VKSRRPSKTGLGKKTVVRRLRLLDLLVVNVYPRSGAIRPVILRALRKLWKHQETLGKELLKHNPKKLTMIVFWYDDQTVRSKETPWGKAARSWNFGKHPFMGETYVAGDWAPGMDILTVMVIPRWLLLEPRDQIEEYSEAVFAFLVHEFVHGFLGVKCESRTERIVDEILENIKGVGLEEKGRGCGRAPLRC